MGGITLGSVAPSFHSEDEDDQQAGWQQQQQQQSKGKGREPYAEEESSILDEEEMAGAGGDSGTGDEEGYILPSQQQQQQQTRPAAAPRPASNSSRPASSASRYPSASTQATTAPSPQPRRPLPSSLVDLGHHGNSRLDDSDERDREQSGMLKELNMDESIDSGRWTGVKGANGVGKKKGGVGQNMTLREQEKVCSEVQMFLSGALLTSSSRNRSSMSSRRRTLTSSSRSTSTSNDSNASLPTKSTLPCGRTSNSKSSFRRYARSSSATRSFYLRATEPSRI